MSIKKFNQFQKINESIGSKKLNDLYSNIKKIYNQAHKDFRNADKEYREHEKSNAEFDKSYYEKRSKASDKLRHFKIMFNNIKDFIQKLDSWAGANIEEMSDSMIDVIDTREEGEDATKLRRKPYSQENYYVLVLKKYDMTVNSRDGVLNDILEDAPNEILAPIGYFKGTSIIGGQGTGYRQGWENRKDLIEEGDVFYAVRANRDEGRQVLRDERREKRRDIVQPSEDRELYDRRAKDRNMERYADKLASKKNFDHIHDLMINIFKLMNDIKLKRLTSLKKGESWRVCR